MWKSSAILGGLLMLCLALTVAGCAGSLGSGSTAPPPPPPGTTSSITKDGITWTFSQPVPTGQFVTGDYYVVGPVTVTAISPAPTTSTPYLNGSVLNLPTANSKSGFDSRLNDGTDQSWWFDASLRSYPPITLHAGDALVSSGHERQPGAGSLCAYGCLCCSLGGCLPALVL